MGSASRSPALLRQRTDCRRVQCCDGAAGPRTPDDPTTLTTYAHLWPTAKDQTRKAAAGLVRAAMRIPADSCGLQGHRPRMTCGYALSQKYQGKGDQSGSRFSRNWSRPSTASSVM
jgi:hypothetical protein